MAAESVILVLDQMQMLDQRSPASAGRQAGGSMSCAAGVDWRPFGVALAASSLARVLEERT